MLMSVAVFLGSCKECTAALAPQLSLWKAAGENVVGFRELGFCRPLPFKLSSVSALEVGTVVAGVVLGTATGAAAGTDSGFCFFTFCSCWLVGRKLPTTT